MVNLAILQTIVDYLEKLIIDTAEADETRLFRCAKTPAAGDEVQPCP